MDLRCLLRVVQFGQGSADSTKRSTHIQPTLLHTHPPPSQSEPVSWGRGEGMTGNTNVSLSVPEFVQDKTTESTRSLPCMRRLCGRTDAYSSTCRLRAVGSHTLVDQHTQRQRHQNEPPFAVNALSYRRRRRLLSP